MSYQVDIRRARSVRSGSSTHSHRILTPDKNISVASQKPDEISAVSTASAHSSTLWPIYIARYHHLRFSLVLHILVFLVGIFSLFVRKNPRRKSSCGERKFGTQWLSKWPSFPSLRPSHPLLFARFAPDRYRRHPWFRSRASPASGQKVPASRALVASMVFDGTRANHSSQWCYAPPLDLPASCSFLPYNFSCS